MGPIFAFGTPNTREFVALHGESSTEVFPRRSVVNEQPFAGPESHPIRIELNMDLSEGAGVHILVPSRCAKIVPSVSVRDIISNIFLLSRKRMCFSFLRPIIRGWPENGILTSGIPPLRRYPKFSQPSTVSDLDGILKLRIRRLLSLREGYYPNRKNGRLWFWRAGAFSEAFRRWSSATAVAPVTRREESFRRRFLLPTASDSVFSGCFDSDGTRAKNCSTWVARVSGFANVNIICDYNVACPGEISPLPKVAAKVRVNGKVQSRKTLISRGRAKEWSVSLGWILWADRSPWNASLAISQKIPRDIDRWNGDTWSETRKGTGVRSPLVIDVDAEEDPS